MVAQFEQAASQTVQMQEEVSRARQEVEQAEDEISRMREAAANLMQSAKQSEDLLEVRNKELENSKAESEAWRMTTLAFAKQAAETTQQAFKRKRQGISQTPDIQPSNLELKGPSEVLKNIEPVLGQPRYNGLPVVVYTVQDGLPVFVQSPYTFTKAGDECQEFPPFEGMRYESLASIKRSHNRMDPLEVMKVIEKRRKTGQGSNVGGRENLQIENDALSREAPPPLFATSPDLGVDGTEDNPINLASLYFT